MLVFLVSVRYSDNRYIDSIWAVQQHAVDRVKELKGSMVRSGLHTGDDKSWNAWWTEGTVADAELKS